ncbi:MAG: response regulator [Desulfuromonadales bacterium]|nr:response regulator [Desulfuromonadales bacterium]
MSVYYEDGTKTILYAEDDDLERGLMAKALARLGYRLIPAVDGQDAITQFLTNREEIHLVVLDVIMPKKNGLETLDEIRKLQPDIKAIFCSACPEAVLQAHGDQEKGVVIFTKPVNMNLLAGKIRELLG